MSARALLVAALLFVSGGCALVYQTVWLREFRLVFGGSTTATAAVLAVFMGGLGFGNLLLGRYADRHASPLRLYAQLELAITLCAALSPWLVDLIRAVYVALGGQAALGVWLATIARLLGTVAVLALPTLLMGGTLPAAAKLVSTSDDAQRRSLGLIYGLNTLGAVVGALASTFLLLPELGTRSTLWLACAVNLLLAVAAWKLAQRPLLAATTAATPTRRERKRLKRTDAGANDEAPSEAPIAPSLSSPRGIYATALALGMAFFLMELVWNRMLSPLLGGTTYTFGIILAVVLAGIGVGGSLYPAIYRRRGPQPLHLAFTCALQAVVTALPLALGDRFALWSVAQLEGGNDEFSSFVIAWTTIVAAMVFPTALISGLQFPILLGLVGRGEEHVARQVGVTFAFNTLGCIAGALLGGFGLIPFLSAPGVWMLVVGLLALISLAWVVPSYATSKAVVALPIAGVAVAIAMLFAEGPTAVWRHSSIGAGRSPFNALTPPERYAALEQGRSGFASLSRNEWLRTRNELARYLRWEKDGVESSLAIRGLDGIALYVNGKSDGNALGDAPTQIMLGIAPAALHPKPKTAFVIGLGTGETAGWLGAVESIERVDCIELEPDVREMARRCAAINHNVLENPKVRLHFNDARESLLSTPEKYDLIISEPSNPFRAGVATLFTREFYRAARERLHEGGIFAQWLQAYETNEQTFATVLSTLRQEFAYVELWQLKQNDLMLVASTESLVYDVARLDALLTQSPFQDALRMAWRAEGTAGLFSAYVGNLQLVDELATSSAGFINTDDHNLLEYAFARTVGDDRMSVSVPDMRNVARNKNLHRAAIAGEVDWSRALDYFLLDCAADGSMPFIVGLDKAQTSRWLAWNAFVHGNFADVLKHWDEQKQTPQSSMELVMLCLAALHQNDARVQTWIDALEVKEPTDADLILSLRAYRDQDYGISARYLERLFLRLREAPCPGLTQSPCPVAVRLADKHPQSIPALYKSLNEAFAVDYMRVPREDALLHLARRLGNAELLSQLERYEPHVPWTEAFLDLRATAYTEANHPLAAHAREQLQQFRAAQ